MRGGVTRMEAFMMSPKERNDTISFINHIFEKQQAAISGAENM